VVSFPPGGGVDAVARLFADKLGGLLGQTGRGGESRRGQRHYRR
jgi:hypothetical protein